jgi:hypothetical protein
MKKTKKTSKSESNLIKIPVLRSFRADFDPLNTYKVNTDLFYDEDEYFASMRD